jgi:hypothetical protein
MLRAKFDLMTKFGDLVRLARDEEVRVRYDGAIVSVWNGPKCVCTFDRSS